MIDQKNPVVGFVMFPRFFVTKIRGTLKDKCGCRKLFVVGGGHIRCYDVVAEYPKSANDHFHVIASISNSFQKSKIHSKLSNRKFDVWL